MNNSKRIALIATLALFAATWVAPRYPVEQALHSILTVIGLLWLVLHDRRCPLRNGHFVLICLFIAIHCIAARWLYSEVPYDTWLRATLGWSPHAAFDWQRNHFDRFVHLLYGICFAPALCHFAMRRWPLRAGQAFVLTVMAIMSSSLIYEWLEWAIALTLSPEAAEAYNGQQGDIWDAHADMLLATLGALATWPWLRRLDRNQNGP